MLTVNPVTDDGCNLLPSEKTTSCLNQDGLAKYLIYLRHLNQINNCVFTLCQRIQDKIMHLCFNFDTRPMHSPFWVCALDALKSQGLFIILSNFTHKGKYTAINL